MQTTTPDLAPSLSLPAETAPSRAQATARRRSAHTAWLFLLPALLLLGLFTYAPVGFNVYLAFTKYTIVNPPEWVGLDNFRYLLEDEIFHTALLNSLLYLLVVPCIQLGAIVLAVAVNNRLPGIRWFRAAFYLPVVTTVSVIGIVWGWMYTDYGLINGALSFLHLVNAPVGFLTDEHLALFAVMFVTFWRGLGYYMVLYLAGLQAIPAEMQEAAILDGANTWQRFWRITLPMLKPTILLCSVLSTISAVKTLEEVFVMTRGGPLNSTYTALYYVYQQGFNAFQFGRGAAAGVVVSAICLALAWANFRFIKPSHR